MLFQVNKKRKENKTKKNHVHDSTHENALKGFKEHGTYHLAVKAESRSRASLMITSYENCMVASGFGATINSYHPTTAGGNKST